jgi:hypothetical protein
VLLVVLVVWVDALIDSADRPAPQPQAFSESRPTAELNTVDPLFGVSLAAGGAAVILVMYLVWGREHRPAFRERYLGEVPDNLPPAVVACLWGMGAVDERAIAARMSISRVVA